MKQLLVSSLLILALLCTGCGGKVPSQVTTALDAIIIAADVAPAAIPNLSPQAAACIAAIPDVVTAISDVIAGSQPLATAQTSVGQLKLLLASTCAVGVIPAKDQQVISGIVGAVQAFLTIYQQQVGGTPIALIQNAYIKGFVDSPNPVVAKYKASRADKKQAAAIKAKAAALKAKIAAAKK